MVERHLYFVVYVANSVEYHIAIGEFLNVVRLIGTDHSHSGHAIISGRNVAYVLVHIEAYTVSRSASTPEAEVSMVVSEEVGSAYDVCTAKGIHVVAFRAVLNRRVHQTCRGVAHYEVLLLPRTDGVFSHFDGCQDVVYQRFGIGRNGIVALQPRGGYRHLGLQRSLGIGHLAAGLLYQSVGFVHRGLHVTGSRGGSGNNRILRIQVAQSPAVCGEVCALGSLLGFGYHGLHGSYITLQGSRAFFRIGQIGLHLGNGFLQYALQCRRIAALIEKREVVTGYICSIRNMSISPQRISLIGNTNSYRGIFCQYQNVFYGNSIQSAIATYGFSRIVFIAHLHKEVSSLIPISSH